MTDKNAHQSLENEVMESLWSLAFRRFLKNKASMVGGIYLLIVIAFGVGADFISPYSYYEMSSKPILMPSIQHLMGTDDFGRDLFSRVVYGARVSIMVGFLSQMVVITMGIIVGGIAGFFGGRTDSVLMRIADVQFTFPPMLLALILLGTVVARSLASIVIVIGLTSWPTMARLVRSQVLSIKQNTYIEAAQVYGASPQRLLFRHILPNILGPIIVQATFGVANAIMIEAFLSFIGLGTPPPMPSWGGILYGSFPWIRVTPTLMIFPAVALSTTLIAINLAGDGLRDALDPKSERYAQM